MPHVFCHDITAYCGSRTKHDQNGNQLVMGKSKSDSNWKKMVQKPISFIKVQAIVAFNLEKLFQNEGHHPWPSVQEVWLFFRGY